MSAVFFKACPSCIGGYRWEVGEANGAVIVEVLVEFIFPGNGGLGPGIGAPINDTSGGDGIELPADVGVGAGAGTTAPGVGVFDGELEGAIVELLNGIGSAFPSVGVGSVGPGA